MSFKDNIKSDFKKCILNKDEMAENILFTPYGSPQKQIVAIVDRRRLNPAAEDNSRLNVNEIEIHISTDPDEGTAFIRRGKDAAIIAEVVGGTSYQFLVVDIIASDDGMWHLLLRR